MSDAQNSTELHAVSPPYISFRTLLNLIERMATEGVPPRIDRSYLTGLSGGYQTQVMAALRSLGLTSDGGAVTQRLLDLADYPDKRKELMGQIIRERYPEAWALGQENATQAQLEETFKPSGITGATLRKAVAFYLHAANYADIPLSPFFKTPSATDTRAAPRRRRARTTTPAQAPPPPAPPAETTPEALRRRYIEMLLKRVEEQEQMDDKLLDRIEGLLGYDSPRDEGEQEE